MKYTPVPNDQYTKEMAKRDARVIKKAMEDTQNIKATVKNLKKWGLPSFAKLIDVEDTPKYKCGETHTTCQTRLDKEGGKARCCYCVPHEGCTVGMKKDTPLLQVEFDEIDRLKRQNRCIFCEKLLDDKNKTICDKCGSIKMNRTDINTPKETWVGRFRKQFTVGDGVWGEIVGKDALNALADDTAIIAFFTKELAQARKDAVREGAHLCVNNYQEWKEQWWRDKSFVGTFGEWLDKKLATLKEGKEEE